MFPAGGHLGLHADMPDTIFKWDHPTTIVTKFGSNWPSSFREEDFLSIFLAKFDEKRAITPKWLFGFSSKFQDK